MCVFNLLYTKPKQITQNLLPISSSQLFSWICSKQTLLHPWFQQNFSKACCLCFSDSFEIQVFLQTLAMIHAIETINNSTLLSGVTLGYEIYDTCAEVTKAMASALRFLSKFNSSENAVEFKCNYSDYIPRVKAVTGASYSEVSMAVSRLLALQLIPQVGLRQLFYFGQWFRFTMLRISFWSQELQKPHI